MKKKTKYWPLLRQSFSYWNEDNVASLAASLAYYTVFSLAPLLIICISIAGLVFGEEAAQGEVLKQFRGLLGSQTAQQVQTMLREANKENTGIISTIVGGILLLIASSWVFGELQTGLNTIWNVKAKSKGIAGFFKDRLMSFAMVLVLGFLLLVSLVLSSVLTAMTAYVSTRFAFISVIAESLNFIVSIGVITVLFAMIFKILPNIKIAWSEVWLGAFVTAILFTIGKLLLGIYFGLSHVSTGFGAAGSLILILVWVYYSAQILYFGAELTKSHSRVKRTR